MQIPYKIISMSFNSNTTILTGEAVIADPVRSAWVHPSF